MNLFPDRTYSSKLLLFGEHLVLQGAMCLAIPYPSYSAQWANEPWTADVGDFLDFLKGIPYLDSDRLKWLENAEMSLRSDIPRGYGLGSSGSLCAAFYEMLRPDHSKLPLDQVINELAEIEGFFHGKSSGLDAFVILMNQPVLVKEGMPSIVDVDITRAPFKIDLVDSGVSRSSKGLIKQFLKSDQQNHPSQELKMVNDQIITAIINEDYTHIKSQLNQLSELQYESMQYLIVDSVKSKWANSLKSESEVMKLCGAGGGGFYLKFVF